MRLTGFDGKTALVTGAAGGIGRAVTQSLLDAGARVIASDTPAALAALAPPVGSLARELDVRDAAAAEALVAEIEAEHYADHESPRLAPASHGKP